VHKSIERISRFSLDMLSYARGRSQSRQQICLNELVEDACDSLSGQAEARGVTVDQQPMIGLPPVWGDLEGLHTCILNLIGNALEAFPENNAGGLVTVQTGVRSDDHIFVQVTDTGKGIGPDLIEHIGKPLFSTKGARGTGLGLAITTKIIHDHGGRIEIQSELHRGSTFTLILPAADSKRTPPDST
jgi:signal transduction histidine kinase